MKNTKLIENKFIPKSKQNLTEAAERKSEVSEGFFDSGEDYWHGEAQKEEMQKEFWKWVMEEHRDERLQLAHEWYTNQSETALTELVSDFLDEKFGSNIQTYDEPNYTDETFDLWYSEAKKVVNSFGYYNWNNEEDEYDTYGLEESSREHNVELSDKTEKEKFLVFLKTNKIKNVEVSGAGTYYHFSFWDLTDDEIKKINDFLGTL